MDNRVGTLYVASLAALGILLLAGPFAFEADRVAGSSGMIRAVQAMLGIGLLGAQALLVYRGMLRAAAVQQSETEELRRRLEEFTGRDELTGAFSRTMFEEVLNRELEAVRRYRVQTSCIMLDVDGLAELNRKHGYRAGDLLLRDLARVLSTNVRVTDSLFHWQGGRFIVLTPHVGVDMAAHLAEKLRRLVEHQIFADDLKVTVCLSVAPVWAADTSEVLVARLRTGLARAKQAGKSRLEVLRGA